MARITAIPYRTHDHGSFDEEWGCHRRVSEWWYATGYFCVTGGDTGDGAMYSYQFTLVRPHLFGLRPNVLMLALTDFATGRHYYAQQTALTTRNITIRNHPVLLLHQHADRRHADPGGSNLAGQGQIVVRQAGRPVQHHEPADPPGVVLAALLRRRGADAVHLSPKQLSGRHLHPARRRRPAPDGLHHPAAGLRAGQRRQVFHRLDPGLAPAGKQLVYACMSCLGDPKTDIAPYLAQVKKIVVKMQPDILAHIEREETFGPATISHIGRDSVLPGRGGEDYGVMLSVGQYGDPRLNGETPIAGLYYVGGDAGGFGLGTHQAVDSAVNVAQMVLAYHRRLGSG